MQFNKGMLSPIESVKLPSTINQNNLAQSPMNHPKSGLNPMNASMYRNQGVNASQNTAPRRMID